MTASARPAWVTAFVAGAWLCSSLISLAAFTIDGHAYAYAYAWCCWLVAVLVLATGRREA